MKMVQDRVRHMHGLELSDSQVREALRALQADGETVCIERTWWQQTDKLRERIASENGALNGNAASAPETGGVAAPPIDKQAHFGLA